MVSGLRPRGDATTSAAWAALLTSSWSPARSPGPFPTPPFRRSGTSSAAPGGCGAIRKAANPRQRACGPGSASRFRWGPHSSSARTAPTSHFRQSP